MSTTLAIITITMVGVALLMLLFLTRAVQELAALVRFFIHGSDD